METTNYSSPIVKVSSATDISHQRQEERKKRSIEKFLITGGTSLLLGVGGKLLLQNDRINKYFNKSVLNASLEETAGRKWSSLFSDKFRSPLHTVLEATRKIEELSPFKVMRTLQMSHLLTPFVAGKEVAVDISSNAIKSQESYFRALLKNRGTQELNQDHLKYGLRLEGGKLYAKTAEGKLGDVVAKHARLSLTHFALPSGDNQKELIYSNKILRQYSTMIGAGQTDTFNKLIGSNTQPFMVMAAETRSKLSYDIFRSYGRTVFETSARVFDNPFEHMTDLFPGLEGNKTWEKLKDYTKLGFGTQGRYRQSVVSGLHMMTGGQLKLFGKIGAYKVASAGVAALASEDSGFSEGILPGLATMAVNTQLAFADTWSDNFQGYREAQEYYAPGSTSLMSIAGTPLALGTAAATASFAKRIYDNARHGIEQSEKNAEALGKMVPQFVEDRLPEFMKGKITQAEGTRMKRWGARAGAIGLLLQAPMIPGALIGESSETLRKQYTGEEDVAVRANRWWFTGSGKYGGDHIKYFDKGAYARMMAGSNYKSKYGDKGTKNEMDPFLHPLDYVRNPYALEQLNAEERPYPVMGMDVSTATFIGKAYEKTIGRIIKPDVFNPDLAQELAATPEGTVSTGGGAVSAAGIDKALDTGVFSLKTPVSKDEASLIEEGKVVAPAAATYEPNTEAATWAGEAAKDFMGLRGWLLGEVEDAMELPELSEAPQLARSGEITNVGRQVRDANLGGLFGLTEPQRRYIPTSASLTKDRVNPLKNNMPDWLPGDDDEFWLNLQRGDPYTKIEHGESRLPGAGYESLNPVLEGINPQDYPDIFKMKVLSDVAMGSDAYYDVKNRIDERAEQNRLTPYEQNMMVDIRKKEFLKSVRRDFSEYKTDAELQDSSTLQRLGAKYWEKGSHGLEKALPSEFLTFFRPAGKLIHQRSAIEDYERTQLEGSDMAIWTKPVEHFIKPTAVASRRLIDSGFISEDVKDKRGINRYFDTLEYVKQRKIYKDAVSSGDGEAARTARAKYQATTEGALASGLDTDQEILRSYTALPKDEKPYFSSFVNARQEDRAKIQEIVPNRISDMYQTIWDRKDMMEKSIASGASIEAANREIVDKVSQEDSIMARNNSSEYKKWQGSGGEKSGSFREHMADRKAEQYLAGSAGIPSQDFSGWDPRIDLDKVKLRALTIGNEDFFKYGFWKDDVKDLQRYVSVIEDPNIQAIADKIKDGMREEEFAKNQIEDSLHREGYNIKRVHVSRGDSGMDLNVETTS
ncbi:MAG: hypothetical protein DRQ78_04985 [Epsilonproteobacteria bacterium]|nr:MAG: hypothetical protein DRQ78_04985 [Campylobacterota bacterium]